MSGSGLQGQEGPCAGAQAALRAARPVPGSQHGSAGQGPATAPRGAGMPREGCQESSAAWSGPVKLGREQGLCRAEAHPASPRGKGWVAAVSRPTPPTTPRSAFSRGFCPAKPLCGQESLLGLAAFAWEQGLDLFSLKAGLSFRTRGTVRQSLASFGVQASPQPQCQ